jgi:predicted choloylglycine hydrolase
LENIKEVTFRHAVLEGTSYEIGKKQGELLKNFYPEEINFYTKGNPYIPPSSLKVVKKSMDLIAPYCPHINEEIKGFADSIGALPEEIIYYSFTYKNKGNCSHFAVLPQQTSDHHTYVGRSYEWDDGDDKRLLTIKAKGLYSHLGFSLLFFGRYDGINEKGLCVTMSNAVPLVQPEEEGLRFWFVIRMLLDTCKNVDEAVELIQKLPISSNCNLILTDTNPEAVLAEIHSETKCFKKITKNSSEGYICSTNHYNLPSMQAFVKNKMNQSLYRYNAIVKTLNHNIIDKETLKNLIASKMPNGMACHFYSEGLGTLWSILYDITNLKAEICFGSPLKNSFYPFDLNIKEGVTEYKTLLPNEKADPQNWVRV